METLLPVSTGSGNRSSPRSRRESPLLPTLDAHLTRRPSLFFRTSTSFKSRKEAKRLLWLGRWLVVRRYLPWVGLILLWFGIGFRLHIRWSEAPGFDDGGRKETELTRHGSEVGRESDRKSEGVFVHGLAEVEDRASVGKEKIPVENVEQEKGVVENVEQQKDIVENVEEESDSTEATKREPHLGRDVGPFDEMEWQLWGKAGKHGRSHCATESRFADAVKSKSFVMVFHELSMTGAPLAMLELATKIVRCGGKATAVILNKRGGLYEELGQRGISVVRDKAASSWKAASRAHLVVAGSAACNSWIEQYLRHNKKGGDRLIWWIMENRREYFDRSKLLLGKARALMFLSETQLQLWRQWATEDALALPSMIKVVSLSVSDDLAAFAGLDDEVGTVESFLEARKKRETLREQVRRGMGLLPSDYLVISLSSVNPGKGQLQLLHAALMVVDINFDDEGRKYLAESAGARSEDLVRDERTDGLKILLGSVGSKSNKPEYLEKIYELVDTYPKLADMLLWTEATVHVGPLYAAADAYVMNAQGIGETFGRVTVEAMAFGLPVLGTDAGGTTEILQGNVSGLLHPTGPAGVPVLARSLEWLLTHSELGVEMGKKGRARVQELYREAPMYEAIASVFLETVQEHHG